MADSNAIPETNGPAQTKHGHAGRGAKSRAYQAWHNMLQRCKNPNWPHFHRYGGRGIAVDVRWNEFSAFLADMGQPPAGKSLDRIDNDSNYCQSNCRWASKQEQAHNRVSNVWLDTSRGRMVLIEAARLAGIDQKTMAGRIKRGVTGEALFARPCAVPLVETSRGLMTIRQIAEEAGVSKGSISTRLRLGWTGEDLFKPADQFRRGQNVAPQPATS